MLKKIIIAGVGTCLSFVVMADYASDYKAAMDLYSKGKSQEAQEAFVKLADTAPAPENKAECLGYAADSLGKLKKYDEAMALARKIEVKAISMNTQMGIMFDNGKFKELTEAFKDEDISVWPEDYRGLGFFRRGSAYSKLKDYESAVKDLGKSVDCKLDDRAKAAFPIELGNNYLMLKDDQKALDAFLRAQTESNKGGSGRAHFYISTIARVNILVRLGKYDDALADIQKIDMSKAPAGYWKFQSLKTFGEVYEAQGKKEEAIAKYKEAIVVKEGVRPADIDTLEKKISALSVK